MQIPIIRARKPPFGSIPRVNYDNPISEGIIGCYLPGLMRGQPIIGGTILANGSDGSGERALTRDGIALKTPAGVGNRGLIGTAPTKFKSGNEFSIQWRGILHGNCDSYAQLILITYDSGDNNPYFVWGLTTDFAGYTMLQAGWNTGGTGQRTAAHDVSSHYGKMIDLVATFRVGGNSTFYINGVQAQVALFGGTPPTSANSQIVIDQYIPGWGRSANASCNIATFWDRELTPSEVQALSTDPYCCLSYPEDEIFATLKGGGAPAGITGTLTASEASDTANINATAVNNGLLTALETADTAAITGTVATLAPANWGYLGNGTVDTATTLSVTLSLTGLETLQQGDLLVACFAYRTTNPASMTLPSGWTLLTDETSNNVQSGTTGIASGMMAYMVRGASDPTALTFTHASGLDVSQGTILAYRPLQLAAFDAFSSNTTATGNTNLSITGLTTTAANDLLVFMTAGGNAGAWSTFDAATDPGTASGTGGQTADVAIGAWQERVDVNTTTGANVSLAIADAEKATAGATGNFTATTTQGAGNVAIVGAFKFFGITGTIVASEAADTALFTGLRAALGILAAVEAVDTASINGTATHTGVLTALEAADTALIIGLRGVLGTLTATEAVDTASINGTAVNNGLLTALEAADTAIINSTVVNVGRLMATEGVDVASINGTAVHTARLTATEGVDVASINATVVNAGLLTALEAADTAVFNGSVFTAGTVSGALAAVEAPDTAAINGAVTGVSGTLVAVEAADVAAIVGTAVNVGRVIATEAADVSIITGTAVNVGRVIATEASDTALFNGTVAAPGAITGILAAIEASDIVLFTGTIPIEPGPEPGPEPLPPSQPGVLKFGRRVTINRW